MSITLYYNFFKFLEQKGEKKIPLKVKFLINPKDIKKEDLKIGGDLYLSNTKITSLPADLKVGGDLDLSNTKITSLPADLKVGGYLYLSNTEITSLPADLKVGGYLFLSNTPLAKKYTKAQISKMTGLEVSKIKLEIRK